MSPIISNQAQIHPSVEIGPYVIIEGSVRIDAHCRILPHAQILGDTHIGSHTTIGRAAIIGENPQDLHFDPATPSGVRIGQHNTIREQTTIHRGSKPHHHTTIGDHNYLMANVHLAHDVTLGHKNILANAVLIAGHVHIGHQTFIGGGAVFHQFLRIGDSCVIQGNSSFSKDIPHYCAAQRTNRITGLNTIGLRRQGFTSEQRKTLKTLFDLIYRSGHNLTQAITIARQQTWPDHAQHFLQFLEAPTKKGICRLHLTPEETE